MTIPIRGARRLQRGGRPAGLIPTRRCPLERRRSVDAVQESRAAYGVLPIENSIGGSIHRNYDLMLERTLPIVGEVELPVVHHLLALPAPR